MQNIEIKAKYKDLSQARRLALKQGARFEGELHQVDTYLNVTSGRLKFREINNSQLQLIFYDRSDLAGPKISDYQIFSNQELPQMRS